MDRRRFLKALGVTGVSALALPLGGDETEGGAGRGEENNREDDGALGILIDTTECVGCRTCEEACAEAHGLPVPDTSEDTDAEAEPTDSRWTVVSQHDQAESGAVFVKRQCMHCLQPACASACLTSAMFKTDRGPVIWRENKCMGCRFCMISCPFDLPRFEYDSPVPRIQKCPMCWERLREGEVPACVENCPAEALTFGKRSELIREARRRIHEEPDRYVDHIYGEHEVGGTSLLYLSAVPFERLRFRTDLGTTPYPSLTTEFLYGVPFVLTLWPALLLAISRARRDAENRGHESQLDR